VVNYTNASCILKSSYRDSEDGDGFFSGWDESKRAYEPESWLYEGGDLGHPKRDLTLQHPRCVFQVLKKHYARYTPEMVQRITGCPPELFHKVAEALCNASGPARTAAMCYAVGWTQHSVGVQIIRTATIVQLLLGNIGRRGGGIMALRGHASIQGSTDIPTLYDSLPGYIPPPRGTKESHEETLKEFYKQYQNDSGIWNNLPAYTVSLLKAYYGKRATRHNDWGWKWHPRINRDHSHLAYFAEMKAGKVEGFFLMGQNPAVGGAHSRFERLALSKLNGWSCATWSKSNRPVGGIIRRKFNVAKSGPKISQRKCFCCRQRVTRKRQGHSRTHNDCCSFAKKRWTRLAIVAVKVGSSINSRRGLSPKRTLPMIRWMNRCARWTGGIPKTRRASRMSKRSLLKSTGGKRILLKGWKVFS